MKTSSPNGHLESIWTLVLGWAGSTPVPNSIHWLRFTASGIENGNPVDGDGVVTMEEFAQELRSSPAYAAATLAWCIAATVASMNVGAN